MNTSRDQALNEIAHIMERHNISAEEVLTVLEPDRPQKSEVRSSGILARVLAYLGGILVLAGIALFIGMQWEQFSSAVRVLVTLGTGFAVFLFALATLSDERFGKVTTPMLLVAALLQPTGILVMLDEYARGGNPEHGLLFMCVVLFVQQSLTFWATRRTALLFTSMFFGTAGFGVLCDILKIDFEIVSVATGIGLLTVSWALDRTIHRGITPFSYFAGAVFFLAGSFEMLEDTVLEIAFFGIAAAIMYLATVARSRTLLFVSVIALTSFTGYFFRDSLANAFGLIVMGLLLIGLSAFAMNLNRKYIRRQEKTQARIAGP